MVLRFTTFRRTRRFNYGVLTLEVTRRLLLCLAKKVTRITLSKLLIVTFLLLVVPFRILIARMSRVGHRLYHLLVCLNRRRILLLRCRSVRTLVRWKLKIRKRTLET